MDKKEVCEFLGKSVRTVAGYMAKGELVVKYVAGRAVFERADVERLKAQFETPIHRGIPLRAVQPSAQREETERPAMQAMQPVAASLPAITEAAESFAASLGKALQAALPPPAKEWKAWLTADEAHEFSGLPKAWLLEMARKVEGTYGSYVAPSCIQAINVGTESRNIWRFSRAALEGRR
jgi:hypothetical protein